MRIEEFDYALSPSLIAQYPSPQRGETRLMVLHRNQGTIEHREFINILNYLHPGDLLVLNNTRVLPEGKEIGADELLLSSWNGRQGDWEVLVRGLGKRENPLTMRLRVN
jgi:S-adenosylmethionine:tRNA ribosyltransferase-isomerase